DAVDVDLLVEVDERRLFVSVLGRFVVQRQARVAVDGAAGFGQQRVEVRIGVDRVGGAAAEHRAHPGVAVRHRGGAPEGGRIELLGEKPGDEQAPLLDLYGGVDADVTQL